MKQYILKYQDFLKIDESRLSPEQTKKYSSIKVVDKVKAIHDRIFGDQERLYFPFDFKIFNKDNKSLTQKRIEKLFADANIEIVSYEQNICKKPDNKNVFKIGKLLQDKKHFNNEDLAMDYAEDVEKTRGVQESYDMYIVISRNKVDIAAMSTNRCWRSCQNLDGGSHKRYVAHDLKQGSIVAYIIKADDKEIDAPEARILIKPFINQNNPDDVILLPATVSYFRGKGIDYRAKEQYPKFYDFLMSWVKSVQPTMNGTYRMQSQIYPDGQTTRTINRELSVEDIEILENPKSRDDIKFAFDIYNMDYNLVKYDDEGFISYDGSINLAGNYRTPPAFLKYIKNIKGSLNFNNGRNGSPRLRNLKNLENLESLVTLDISKTKILKYKKGSNDELVLDIVKTLEELKGLKCQVKNIIPAELTKPYIYLKNPDFEKSIKNPKTKEDFINLFNFFDIDFSSDDLKVNENGKIDYSDTLTIDTKSYDEIKDIIKHFDSLKGLNIYSRVDMGDFEGFENIKRIDYLVVNQNSNINSYKGLKDVDVKWFDMGDNIGYREYYKLRYSNIQEILDNPKDIDECLVAMAYDGKLEYRYISVDADNLINYKSNYSLYMEYDIKKLPEYFRYIKSIQDLDFSYCKSLENVDVFSNLKYVRNLVFYECKNLKNVDGLKNLRNVDGDIISVDFSFCGSLENIDGLKNIKRFDMLGLTSCKKLESLDVLEGIENINMLGLQGCKNIKSIRFLKNITEMETLNLSNCINLESLEGLENLKNVSEFYMDGCEKIKDLKPIKNMKKISRVLMLPESLESLEGLENVKVSDIKPNSMRLKFIEINKHIQKSIENPKTKKDFELVNDIYGISINPSFIETNENGLKTYNGGILFSKPFDKFPKFLKGFEVINGDLGFRPNDGNDIGKNIVSVENLENLKEVGRGLSFYGTSIKSLSELKNLKRVGWLVVPDDFEDFDSLYNIEVENRIYPDSVNEEYIKHKYPDWKERIENPKSVEDFGFIKNADKFAKKLDISKIKFDTDGLVIYDWDIDFSDNKDLKEFPKWMNLFKEIRGNLDCSKTSITDFTGLEKLTKIGGGLDCPRTSITDFTGLGELKEIGGRLDCYGSSITDFTGLNNLTKIGGSLWCTRTSITSFNGLENLKKIGGSLDCRETSITSFKGLEQCELNPDYIQPKKFQEKYKEWKKTIKKS